MDCLFDINGTISHMNNHAGLERLKEKVKEFLDIVIGAADLPSFIKDVIEEREDYKEIIKNFFNYLRGSEVPLPDVNIFNRIEQLTIFIKKTHDFFTNYELFISNGKDYIHTNCFNCRESGIYYFEYYVPLARYFFPENPIFIRYMDSDTSFVIDVIKTQLINGQPLESGRIPIEVLTGAGTIDILSPLAKYYESCPRQKKNLEKAIILYQQCYQALQYKRTIHARPLFEDRSIEYCYNIARCYLKLHRIKDYIDWLEIGSKVEGNKNVCAYELAGLYRKGRYVERGRMDLVIDYYTRSGDLGLIELGHIYLTGDCGEAVNYQRALDYYQRAPEPFCFGIGYCLYKLGLINDALDIISGDDFQEFDYICIGGLLSDVIRYIENNIITEAVDELLLVTYNIGFCGKHTKWYQFFGGIIYEKATYIVDNYYRDDIASRLSLILYYCYKEGIGTNKNPRRAFNTLNDYWLSYPDTDDTTILGILEELYRKGIGTPSSESIANQLRRRIYEIIGEIENNPNETENDVEEV